MTNFHWVDGKSPRDSPVCGWDHSKCPEGYPAHTYILAGLGIVVVSFFIAFILIYRHYRAPPELAKMTWKIKWEELDGEDCRREKKKKRQRNSSAAKLARSDAVEQSEALLRCNSRMSVGSDKRSSSSGATRKISTMIDRKFSMFTRHVDTGISAMEMQKNQIFIQTAIYKGTMVAIKMLNLDLKKYQKLELPRALLVQLKEMKDLQHEHITRFCGACVDAPNYCIVTEYCQKGSLEDILENETFKLDKLMKYSLLHDLVKGMHYLHRTSVTHGRLKSSNCVVDSRFVLKVTDFGLAELHAMEEPEELGTYSYYKKKLWTAPELLRNPNAPIQGTQKGDVYSFALILHEMLYRKGAFYRGEEESPTPQEILQQLQMITPMDAELYRPVIPDFSPVDDTTETVKKLLDLMMACWGDIPHLRPDFSTIRKVVHTLNKENETSNLVDNLLKRMEQYATNLEGLVEERTQEYLGEKKKVSWAQIL